ncbi:MAG: hypothetical protein HQL48_08835, partial [Gammaproteobacteria bacterium]|nr:hypothetical protein [Gammaproteobacteria bacterium]
AREEYGASGWSEEGVARLEAIQLAASRFGYRLIRYRQRGSESDYVILTEQGSEGDAETGESERRYWGTYLFRPGRGGRYLLQAPRPLFEATSFEVAVHLFESLQGRWLSIGGTHPNANRDGSSDLIRARSPLHLFNLINQVVLREEGSAPLLVVQCRAYSPSGTAAQESSDLLVAFSDGVRSGDQLSAEGVALLSLLQEQGLEYRFVDGSEGSSGYEVGLIPQARYLDATLNKSFALLWLAPEARRGFRQQFANRSHEARMGALGVDSSHGDLLSELGEEPPIHLPAASGGLEQAVEILQESGDILPLYRLTRAQPQLRFTHLVDINTAQSYLLGREKGGRWFMVANLEPREAGTVVAWQEDGAVEPQIARFLATRSGLLLRRNRGEEE